MSFTKNLIIYGLGTVLVKISSIIFVPIFTRFFSPEIFGAYDLILSVCILFYLIAILQLDSGLSRFYYEEKKKNRQEKLVNTVITTIIITSLTVSLTLIFSSSLISQLLFDSKIYKSAIIICAITVPLYSLHAIFSTILRFQDKAKKFIGMNLLQVFSMLFSSIFLVFYFELGIEGLFLGILFSYFISVSGFFLWIFTKIKLKIDNKLLIKLFKFSFPTVPSAILGWVNNYATRIIIVIYLSVFENGVYAAAFKLGAVFLIFDVALRMTWSPFFWKNFGKTNNIENLRTIYLVIISMIFSVLFVFIIFSHDIFKVFTPSEYWEGTIIVGLLALSNVVFSIINIVGMGPDIVKKTHLISLFNGLAFLLNIILVLNYIDAFGLIVVPVSLLISNCILLLLLWFKSEKLYYIGYSYKHFLLYFSISIILIFIINTYLTSFLYKSIISVIFLISMFILNKKNFIKFFNSSLY